MKTKIFILSCLFLLTKIYANETYYTKIKITTYEHSELLNTEEISISYDKNGYITNYLTKFINNDSLISKTINYNCLYKNNSFTLNYEINEDNEITKGSENFIFKNNSWKLQENESNYSSNIGLNIIQIESSDLEYPYYLKIEKDKIILSSSYTLYNYTLNKGQIIELFNSEYENYPKDSFEYIDNYKNSYSYSENLIKYSSIFEKYTTEYEIETNYDFVTWKASAANFILDISDPVIIPFILGFGNGFEFQEGVDYSGENEEPLKKNDETVEVVQPVTSKNNTPVIIIIAALLSILLVCTIIIIAKKKKK